MIQMQMEEKQLSNEELARVLKLEESEVHMLYKGRLYLSLEQLNALSIFLNESIDMLIEGNEEYYNKNVVHCMTAFSDNNNRELILDFIDSYMDIYKAAKIN
jgi:transcriptional regulator with XRE-family HTH domain